MRYKLDPFAPLGISPDEEPKVIIQKSSNGYVSQGKDGVSGKDGIGVVAGGTTGQALVKKSNTDYDTEWKTVEGGTGTSDHSALTNLDYASSGHTGFQPAGTYVESIVAGANVTVDNTDPANPVVSASGEGGTTDHAALSHLAYADSGHTGFEPAKGEDDNYVTDAEKLALHPAVTLAGEDYLTLSTQQITANPIDLDNLSATGTPSANTYLRGDNTWADVSVGSGGYAADLYFTTIDSDVAGYKKISYTHEETETILTAQVTNEEKLIRSYLYDGAIGTTVIDGGRWVVSYYAKVNITAGTTTLNVETFVRHADNSETTLFKSDGIDINSANYILIRADTIQPAFTVVATDRLGIRVYAETTSLATITISTKVGDGNASYFTTPIAIRHTQLRGLNDDTNNVHVTSTEKTAITHSNRTVLDNTTASFTTDDESKLDGLTQYTDEMAQDAVGNAVGNGLDYNDTSGAISVDETELAHNSLGSKQGGTTDEYYHLTYAQTLAVHAPVTVTDSSEIDFTLTGQDITASIKTGSIDETKLDTSTNASLDKADSALQTNSALGTPASGTLTNCSGLPLSGVVDSTSEALGVGTLELGHATDTTLSRVSAGVVAVEGVKIPAIAPGPSGNLMASNGTDWVSQNNDGWINANDSWTCASVDNKIVVITVASGATDKYSIGMRIKWNIIVTVYGIIVSVSDTTITVFIGNSWAPTVGTSNTNTNYSMMKAPFGFPASPTYWQVSYSFATMTGPDAPTAFTWYNNGSSYSIPIGSWNILIKTISNIERNTGGFISTEISFSTTNNAAGEAYLSCKSAFRENANPCQQATNFIQGPLTVTTKTTYYLNERTLNTGCQYLRLQQDNAPTTVILTCAYL